MSTGDGGRRGVSPPLAGLGRRGSAQGSPGACRRSAAAFLGGEGGAGILDSDPPLPRVWCSARRRRAPSPSVPTRVRAPRGAVCLPIPLRGRCRGRGEARGEIIGATLLLCRSCVPGGGRMGGARLGRPRVPEGSRSAAGRCGGTPSPRPHSEEDSAGAANGIRLKTGKG